MPPRPVSNNAKKESAKKEPYDSASSELPDLPDLPDLPHLVPRRMASWMASCHVADAAELSPMPPRPVSNNAKKESAKKEPYDSASSELPNLPDLPNMPSLVPRRMALRYDADAAELSPIRGTSRKRVLEPVADSLVEKRAKTEATKLALELISTALSTSNLPDSEVNYDSAQAPVPEGTCLPPHISCVPFANLGEMVDAVVECAVKRVCGDGPLNIKNNFTAFFDLGRVPFSKVDGKRYIGVERSWAGYHDDDGNRFLEFHTITEVTPGGAAARHGRIPVTSPDDDGSAVVAVVAINKELLLKDEDWDKAMNAPSEDEPIWLTVCDASKVNLLTNLRKELTATPEVVVEDES